jgi:hypothetical protein
MNASALAVGALACVAAFLLLFPFVPEISAGVRTLRGAIALFVFSRLGDFERKALAVTAAAATISALVIPAPWGAIIAGCEIAAGVLFIAPECLGAIMDAGRAKPAREVVRIAAIAALAAAIITGAVSAGYAAPLVREPGDVVYLPSMAVRADGRLSLAPEMTIAEAARAYAGPREYWSSTCRATLPGWYTPVEWTGLDAVNAPLWRATISGAGIVEVSGLGPAESDSLRAFLAELAKTVACD